MSKRKHPSKETLEKLYLVDGLNGTQIAKMHNMSKVCLCRALHKFDIPVRPTAGKNHPNWKGGRVELMGYIGILAPNHHRANHVGYVKEHILIMEGVIGRPLKKEEHIHHIDFDKQNNEISNLWMTSSKKHNVAQNSIFKLIKSLLKQEAIKFDTESGKYINCK